MEYYEINHQSVTNNPIVDYYVSGKWFIEWMIILYILIYGVHSMKLIYYIMKLEFVAMPAGKRTLIVGGPRGDSHSDR